MWLGQRAFTKERKKERKKKRKKEGRKERKVRGDIELKVEMEEHIKEGEKSLLATLDIFLPTKKFILCDHVEAFQHFF